MSQKTNRQAQVELLLSLIESANVKQSTKNANASFIDSRDWASILGTVKEIRKLN